MNRLIIFISFLPYILTKEMCFEEVFGKYPSFAEYVKIFKKSYNKTEEVQRHKDTYEAKLCVIDAHNKRFYYGEVTWEMGVNQFTDLNQDERFGKIESQQPVPQNIFDVKVKFVEIVDWRDQGILTPVKELQTEHSHVYAAIAALEAHFGITYRMPDSLSIQYILDCANLNCDKKTPEAVFDFVRHNGIIREKDYFRNSEENSCLISSRTEILFAREQNLLKSTDISLIFSALERQGPLTITMHIGSLHDYNGGILSDESVCDYSRTVHFLLVGYSNKVNASGFYIVRTHFGPNWGEQGHFRFKSGINFCGFENLRFPVV